jgi:hypothetical protein
MRILHPEPTTPEGTPEQAGSILITSPSAANAAPTARPAHAPTAVHPRDTSALTVAAESLAVSAAGGRLSQPAALPVARVETPTSTATAAPITAHAAGLVPRPIATQGPDSVRVIPDAVQILPMKFAAVHHQDLHASRTGQGPDASIDWNTYVTGTDSVAAGFAVATDQGSNAYVAGSVGEGDSMMSFVAKYTNTGRQIYYTEFQAVDPDPQYTYGSTEAHGIAVDSTGNVYVTGTATRLETGNSQAFAMKFDQFGNIVTGYGGGIARTPTQDSSGNGIAVDADGRATITGSAQITDTETEIFAVKFTIAGNLALYAAAYQFPGFDGSAGQAVTLDATADNAYLVGSILPSGETQDDILALKVDNTGLHAGEHVSWALSAVNDGEDVLTGVGVTSAGQAIVVGTVTDTGHLVAYVAEINDTGDNFLYTDVFDDTLSGAGISLDSDSNAFVTGSLIDTDGLQHAYVGKLDPLGILVDATITAGDTAEVGQGISFRNDSAFVVGTTSSTDLSTDGTTLNGDTDAFLAKVTNFN